MVPSKSDIGTWGHFNEYSIAGCGEYKSCLLIAPDRYRAISLAIYTISAVAAYWRNFIDLPFFGSAKSSRPFNDSASRSPVRLNHISTVKSHLLILSSSAVVSFPLKSRNLTRSA